MAKPSSHLDWAVSNPNPSVNIIEPSSAKKIAAWAADERPPYEFFNWLFFRIDEWLKYFEQTTDAQDARFDAVIGAGPAATHATLQDAVNDVALGTDLWVLVEDSDTIDTTIQMTKARWRVEFRPGVVYTKGVATTMLQMDAEGIEIYWGRFVGWTVGGDTVFEQTANCSYGKVVGARFGPGTDTEVDQSAVTAGHEGPVSDTISEA